MAASVTDLVPNAWQRLSPWSVFHFAQKAIVQNIRGLIFAGAPAWFGASRMGPDAMPMFVPIAIIALVLLGSTITFLFYRYRVVEDAVQVKRGMLFKKHLNLTFQRMQNVSIEHPFYFRPLGRVTVKIDGAGSKGEEINVAALTLKQAQAIRDYILQQKRELAAGASGAGLQTGSVDAANGDTGGTAEQGLAPEELFFTRAVGDLIVHGLTNNRAFIAVAAILGFLAQSGVSPGDVAQRLGIDFDVVVAGLSLVRLTILVVVSLIAAIGVVALLSVLVSIVTYYGFSMYRTADSLTIRRGLLTKHEIHVRKSRIQTIQIRQDWLDRLLGRHNIILERMTHSTGQQDPFAAQTRRLLVPSVRTSETAIVTDEILPGCRLEELRFTPVSFRYFKKHSILASLGYLVALTGSMLLPPAMSWVTVAFAVVWPLHVFHIFLQWKRGGLAIDGDVVIARSGAIGIDYKLFAAEKAQDVTHIQSILMRRRNLSSLKVNTASTTIKVPYMPTEFIRKVVDFCTFKVESTSRSWM